jgi:cell division septation protein DedD
LPGKGGVDVSKQEEKGKEKKQVTLTISGVRLLGYGLTILFMMVWVFVLGVLAGRGDVNHLFQRLGLFKTDLAARLGVAPESQVTPVLPLAAGPKPEEAQPALAEADKKAALDAKAVAAVPAVPSSPGKATDVSASKASSETAKKPGAAPKLEAKKAKGLVPQKLDQDPSLAAKLSFQNSLDSTTRKQPKTPAKKEPTAHTASIMPTTSQPLAESETAGEKKKAPCAYQVKVATYRTPEEAEKALADLKKKGFKVSLQQGKDKTGSTFVIKTGRFNTKSEAEKISQKLKEAKCSGQIQELKQ